MKIDYEVIWVENSRMLFKQFSYEVGESNLPITAILPQEVIDFSSRLIAKKMDVIITCGEPERTGTGILRYSGASPVNE